MLSSLALYGLSHHPSHHPYYFSMDLVFSMQTKETGQVRLVRTHVVWQPSLLAALHIHGSKQQEVTLTYTDHLCFGSGVNKADLVPASSQFSVV